MTARRHILRLMTFLVARLMDPPEGNVTDAPESRFPRFEDLMLSVRDQLPNLSTPIEKVDLVVATTLAWLRTEQPWPNEDDNVVNGAVLADAFFRLHAIKINGDEIMDYLAKPADADPQKIEEVRDALLELLPQWREAPDPTVWVCEVPTVLSSASRERAVCPCQA